MKVAYQSTCSCSVNRDNEELFSKSVLMSTGYEATAQIMVDVSSFAIKDARWDIFRSPKGFTNEGKELPELKGIEAYLYSGSQIRQAVGKDINEIPLDLVSECVMGVVQSESFLIKERGYSSPKQYDEYWETGNAGLCRYNSNMDRVTRHWSENIGDHSRDSALFNRHKNYILFHQPDGYLSATAGFIDSFHEIGLTLTLSREGQIIGYSGNFLRGPDNVCFDSTELLQNLIGKNLAEMSKKEMAFYLGGPSGCTHLMEIFHDLRKVVRGYTGTFFL